MSKEKVLSKYPDAHLLTDVGHNITLNVYSGNDVNAPSHTETGPMNFIISDGEVIGQSLNPEYAWESVLEQSKTELETAKELVQKLEKELV